MRVLPYFSLLFLFVSFSVASLSHHQLLLNGYVEEHSLFHRHYVKDAHTVILPYEDNRPWNPEYLKQFRPNRLSGTEESPDEIGFWDFLPFQIGTMFPGDTIYWKGICFQEMSATFSANSTGGQIVIDAKQKSKVLCNDFYDFGNRYNGYLHVIRSVGKTTITISSWAQYEWDDIRMHGLQVYLFPGSIEDTLASVALTLSLFLDPNPLMVKENQEFISEKLQWNMITRNHNQVNISAAEIRSGDYLGIMRMDGLDPLIMWGTGGHTGHTAVALWFGDELYVCESTDTEGLGFLVYWPPPYGIIRTPYEQWIQQAMDANYHVVLLPLADDYSKAFNEQAAVNWFYSVQGMPYGWHNFLFTWLDTETNNLPRPITPDFYEYLMGVLERLIPSDMKSSVYSMLIMGLNLRLNSNCETLHCIYQIIDPMGMNLAQVTAIPENDAWTYNGNYSMVCDVFVCEMWKNAGIFGNLTNNFQCTEQTPKDTYQWAIFKGDYLRPQQCIDADMDLPYCQLMGKYQLTLPGYNSISMYDNINNACPSVPPVYMRGTGC